MHFLEVYEVLWGLYCAFGFRSPEATNEDHAAAAEESAGSFLAKAIHSMEENVDGTVNVENNAMPEAGDFTENGNFNVAVKPIQNVVMS